MKLSNVRSNVLASVVVSALSACGGSESGTSAALESIKLGGPLTLAAVASDVPGIDGTVAISDTMVAFPQGVISDFATRFPGIDAEEQFRKISYSSGVIVSELYGVEGEGADGEVAASYSIEGNFMSSSTSIESGVLPQFIQQVLDTMYPGGEIESEQITDESGTVTYQVESESANQKSELTLDATGNVLSTHEEVQLSQVPAPVLDRVNGELIGYDELEIEKITMADGVVRYEAELENEAESVSFTIAESGEIVVIEYEVDL